MSLKQLLLSTGLVNDNKYLDKYCELIQNNKNTKCKKYVTQKHHIIPRHYFKLNNLDVDNSEDNLVNLMYRDHIMAHYYLGRCASNARYRFCNYTAVGYVWRTVRSKELSIDAELLGDIQTAYEDSKSYFSKLISEKLKGRKKKPFTKEHRENISKSHKNLFKWVHKDGIVRQCPSNEVPNMIKQGWKLGRNKQSQATIEALTKTRKNRVYVNKDGIDKRVLSNDLTKYLSDGWVIGQCDKHKKAVSNLVWLNNGIISRRIDKSKIDEYLKDGWNQGRIGWKGK